MDDSKGNTPHRWRATTAAVVALVVAVVALAVAAAVALVVAVAALAVAAVAAVAMAAARAALLRRWSVVLLKHTGGLAESRELYR